MLQIEQDRREADELCETLIKLRKKAPKQYATNLRKELDLHFNRVTSAPVSEAILPSSLSTQGYIDEIKAKEANQKIVEGENEHLRQRITVETAEIKGLEDYHRALNTYLRTLFN